MTSITDVTSPLPHLEVRNVFDLLDYNLQRKGELLLETILPSYYSSLLQLT